MSIPKIEAILKKIQGKQLTLQERIETALCIAKALHAQTRKERSFWEKMKEKALSRIMEAPQGRAFLTEMADITFRSKDPARTIDQILFLLQKTPSLTFLTPLERFLFFLFKKFGPIAPKFFFSLLFKKLHGELSRVLLPSNPEKRKKYQEKCRSKGIQLNLNHLGEAILSEAEAQRRLEMYCADLKDPTVDYISIKISTLYSQISPTNFQGNLSILQKRLRSLYRLCGPQQFINLDMEEYRDLDLTVCLFKTVLEEPEFLHLKAGIVIQAYLPDSFEALQDLTFWAMNRRKLGGAPIKVRLVKGANLAMERVESSQHGWNQAPFLKKSETDAHFKKLMHFAFHKQHIDAVHIGIGSHNLFDIAYAFVLSAENEVQEYVDFEMLCGIAAPLARSVLKLKGKLILYSPDAKAKDFEHALAYLIRRLDENGSEENFLRHYFHIQPGNSAWEFQKIRFCDACYLSESIDSTPQRKAHYPLQKTPFKTLSDTDFVVKENRAKVELLYENLGKTAWPKIPLVICGEEQYRKDQHKGIDPSNPHKTLYEASLGGLDDIQKIIECAEKASIDTIKETSRKLQLCAQLLEERRFEFLQALVEDAGKIPLEGDIEFTEAIDFLTYYSNEGKNLLLDPHIQSEGRGPTLVAPPWNFSSSIPAGGIAAALIAGNNVIFKPAPQTMLVGYMIAQAFWDAGISKERLQFFNCREEEVGTALLKHPGLKTVVLTGASQTARLFQKLNPKLYVKAETGGKNALILSNLCDKDLAIRDFLASAFGHAGQKCSACSLLLLHKELYDDPSFLRQIKEAAESLVSSSAHNPACKIPPMIAPPSGDLLKGLTSLEGGEHWLIEPTQVGDNPHLWSPGIKLGVKPGSFAHTTEFFGPLVSVMRIESIEEGIKIANGTAYGLTSGIHSLDPREIKLWESRIIAGNLYTNRSITGAIVKRQPFGGCKESSFGGYAKAGGPNYIVQLCHIEEVSVPKDKAALPQTIMPLLASLHRFDLSESEQEIFRRSVESYAFWYSQLRRKILMANLVGQENFFYHKPLDHINIRIEEGDHPLDYLRAIAACEICRVPFSLSGSFSLALPGLVVEPTAQFYEKNHGDTRLFSTPRWDLLKHERFKFCYEAVRAWGRLELLHYMREVSVSRETHRYGLLL